jgi:amino-acid N-acetyltransferase
MSNEPVRPQPNRIRITRLSEVQLADVVSIEASAKEDFHRHKITMPVRELAELVKLTRDHNVKVAEADDVVAGWLAWRDESPGIAHLDTVVVEPSYRRLGVATKLVGELRDEARGLRLPQVVVVVPAKATWARTFLTTLGFQDADGRAPDRVQQWLAEQIEAEAGPGADEVLLWAST